MSSITQGSSFKDTSANMLAAAMGQDRISHPIGAALRKVESDFQEKERQAREEQMRNRSGFGLFACRVLYNESFDVAMGVVICVNVAVMVIESNEIAACISEGIQCEPGWVLEIFNYAFLSLYSLELVLRMTVDRMHFFCNGWNALDLVVVVTGWIGILVRALADWLELPGFSVLRIFRVLRLLRAVRLMRFFPALSSMVSGFVSVMKAMAWGLVLILIILLVFSILSVDLIAPAQSALNSDNEWCNAAFSSVYLSWLFFFQVVVTQDSWGVCAIPLIQEHWYLFMVFAGGFCVVELGFMNLILSAIIDCATESHEQDIEQRAADLAKEKAKSIELLVKIFESIDQDQDGHLSLEELLDSFDKNKKVNAIFRLHDVGREDMSTLFQFMDKDKSGSINYDEFVTCLRKAMQQDIRMQTMCLKLQLESISSELHNGIREVKQHLEGLSRELQWGRCHAEPPQDEDVDHCCSETPREDKDASATSACATTLEEPAAGVCEKRSSSWKRMAAATTSAGAIRKMQRRPQRLRHHEVEEKADGEESTCCQDVEQRHQETQQQCRDPSEAFIRRGAPRAASEPPVVWGGSLQAGQDCPPWQAPCSGAAGSSLPPGAEELLQSPRLAIPAAGSDRDSLAEQLRARRESQRELRRKQHQLADVLQGILPVAVGNRQAPEALPPLSSPWTTSSLHAGAGGMGWPYAMATAQPAPGLANATPPAQLLALPSSFQASQNYLLHGIAFPSGSLQAGPQQVVSLGRVPHSSWAAPLQ